jgi:hypothetical protein
VAIATLVLYLAAGLLVAFALARKAPATVPAFALRAILWPVFVPLFAPEAPPPSAPGDEGRIRAAEASLADSLRALGGVLGDGLTLEMRRVEALGKALRSAAARKVELDGLLAMPEHDLAKLVAEHERLVAAHDGSAVAEILAQRIEHVRRLQALRNQTQAEFDRAVARAGELATRLTLLRYDTGAGSGAAVTAQQLASSIDELCSVLGEVRAA